MLKSLQKPLLKLNWGGLPTLLEKKGGGELLCYCLADLIRTVNHTVDVNQSKERWAAHVGFWASDQNLFCTFPDVTVQTYPHTVHSSAPAPAACTPQLLPQPGAFHTLCPFHGVLLTLSFNPMWGADEYYPSSMPCSRMFTLIVLSLLMAPCFK